MTDAPVARAEPRRIPQVELIVLMAMTVATVALSIDTMLPALPEIGQELSPDRINAAQLVLTSFVLGMGLGTFVTGPLSDAFGRRKVMVGGAVVYISACLWCYFAQTLEMVLLARLVQGLGAAGPRVVALAIVRDLYSGREMARIVSFMMTVFSMVPAIAPALGVLVIAVSGWREIFLVFIVFSLATTLWLLIRQPETLRPDARRSLRPALLAEGLREMFANETVRLCIIVLSLVFAMLFATLSTTQQTFDLVFGRGASFPAWFAGIAVFSASSGLLNARLVIRLGMRPIVKATLNVQFFVALTVLVTWPLGLHPELLFAIYVVWIVSIFYQAGLTIGNLNALAMEPMGHIAGMVASMLAAIATVVAVIIAVPIGLAFNETPVPAAAGAVVCAALARYFTGKIRRETDA